MTEAAFFDRDGTLCHNDEREERFRDECISRWAGHAFELPYDKFISAFNALGARYPSLRGADTPERERDFFYEWYRVILTGEGICEGVDEKAALLTSRLWVQATAFSEMNRMSPGCILSRGYFFTTSAMSSSLVIRWVLTGIRR